MKTQGAPLDEPRKFPFDLILASTSPRRIDLLTKAKYAFRSIAPGVEESDASHFTPRELSLLNARRKARAVAAFCPASVVIGADTVVSIDGKALGKPNDLSEAAEMLGRLNGRKHEVLTSVCLMRMQPFGAEIFTEVSEVTFRLLDRKQIDTYLQKIDPLDKAGGYAAQEYREEIIEKIEGSLSNVVGLPLETLNLALEKFQGSQRIVL